MTDYRPAEQQRLADIAESNRRGQERRAKAPKSNGGGEKLDPAALALKGVYLPSITDADPGLPIENEAAEIEARAKAAYAKPWSMALEMVAAICGDSAIKWHEAEETAVSAMRSRVQFWDSVVATVHQHRFNATG